MQPMFRLSAHGFGTPANATQYGLHMHWVPLCCHSRSQNCMPMCLLLQLWSHGTSSQYTDIAIPCQEVEQASCFWAKGTKIGMSRFFGCLHKFRFEEDRLWHTRLVGLLYWAVMAGKMSKSSMLELDRSKCQVKVGEAESAMPVPQGNYELKQLRSLCDNGLHMAVVVYSHGENLSKMRAICAITRAVGDWHGEQNRTLRSVQGASRWLKAQCAGAFFDPLVDVLSCLTCPAALSRMGLDIGLDTSTRDLPLEHPRVAQANDLASFAAGLALTLVGCRERRCLWLTAGWPTMFCLLAHEDPDLRGKTRDQLKNDLKHFEWLKQGGRRSLTLVCKRSCFNTASVKQLVAVMSRFGWEVARPVIDFSNELGRCILSSQVVEDGFNRERRAEGKGVSKRMSDTRVYSALIEKQVLDKVHDYTPLEYKSATVPRDAALPSHAFNALQKHESMDLKGIQSFSATPPWYSANAQHWTQKFADMALAREAYAAQDSTMMDTTWLSCLLDSTSIMVRRKAPGSSWMLSLGTLASGLGALGWPAQEVRVGPGDAMFQPMLGTAGKALHWLFVCDLEQWEARQLVWKSPLWTCLKTGNSQLHGIMAEASGPEPLLRIAARGAFWHIQKALLVKLAEHIGVFVQVGWSLFELLVHLMRHVLDGISDDELLAILQLRLKPKQIGALDLCDVDIVEDILDKDDLQEMKKARKEAEAEESNLEIFRSEFATFESKVLKARKGAAAATAPTPKRAKQRRGASSQSSTARQLPPGELTQQQVQAMAPPGAIAWRSKTGTWRTRLGEGFPGFARSWAKYGERAAATICLQECWKQYLDANGLTTADCDVIGLF
jgi:hypothetical protein